MHCLVMGEAKQDTATAVRALVNVAHNDLNEEEVDVILAHTQMLLKQNDRIGDSFREEETEVDNGKSKSELEFVFKPSRLSLTSEEALGGSDESTEEILILDSDSNESVAGNKRLYVKVGGSTSNDCGCGGSSYYTPPIVPIPPCASFRERTLPYEKEAVARYCESIPPGSDANPAIIGDIIRDLHCVFEKTFGQRKDIESRYKNVQCELDALRKQLEECECIKEELQQEICRLQAELRAAQYAFEEEAQRRIGLESMVTQLRAQLNRLEQMADADAEEKARLIQTLRDLEFKMKQMADMIACLQAERDQLLRNCRGFEDWKSKHSDSLNDSHGRCSDLEDALERCCKENEELQRQIAELRRENECLKACVEQLQNDKRRMAEEFERERQCWAKERARYEQAIAELKKALDCLTQQNQAICQKMNEVVAAHHAELDCLRREVEKFRQLYECEKAQREKLEKLLEDCEEKKRQMLLQQQRNQQSTPCRDPCTDIWNKFSSNQGEYNQDLKSRLNAANTKMAGMEKDIQHTQTRLQEQTAANNSAQNEIKNLNAKTQSLEIDKLRAKEESEKLKANNQTLTVANMQLQKELEARNLALAERKCAQVQSEENFANNNLNDKVTMELLKREYEDQASKTQLEIKELTNKILKSEITVATMELEKRNWETKYQGLKDDKDNLERKLLELQPVSSEAQFYKRELDRHQTELKAREEKLEKVTALLHSTEEGLRDSEARLARLLEKDNNSPNLEAVIAELREKLRYNELEKVRFEEMAKNLETRLEYIQPKLDEAFEQRKGLEERVTQITDENRKLQRNVEEEKVTRELFHRELKDAKNQWEAAVKAKGILAEQIAKNDRMSHQQDARSKQDQSEFDRLREKMRLQKAELKAERDQVIKLKGKIDAQREQIRIARDQVQQFTTDPQFLKLVSHMEQERIEHSNALEISNREKQALLAEIRRLEHEKNVTSRELKETKRELQTNDVNKEMIQEITKRKDRLEKEVQELRLALKDRYVERSDVDKWKAAYESRITLLQAQYQDKVDKQVEEKLTHYKVYMDRETQDRAMIQEYRDANDNVLRTEYSQVANSMKADLVKMKSLVKEREEEISSLKLSIALLKKKYSSEANMKEELLKQLQNLAASKTSIPEISSETRTAS